MRVPNVHSLFQARASALSGTRAESEGFVGALAAAGKAQAAQVDGAQNTQNRLHAGLSEQDLAVLQRLQQAMLAQRSTPAAPAVAVPAARKATTASAATAAPATGKGNAVTEYALQFLGTPYVWGGEDLQKGADCSGFTQSVYKQFGVDLSRTANRQSMQGAAVDYENLQPGDILCFDTADYAPVTHAAIYLGDDKFVHASSSKGKVVIGEFNNWWRQRLVTARRVL